MRLILKSVFVLTMLCSISASSAVNYDYKVLVPAVSAERHAASGDPWLMILVATTLIGYQMRRKHRYLKVRPFGF